MVRDADVMRLASMLPTGSFIREYLYYCYQITDAPLAYSLLGAITCLASVAPTDLTDRSTRANVFGLLVGPPGDRKSHALSIARRVLQGTLPERIGPHYGSKQALAEGLTENPYQTGFYAELGDFLSPAQLKGSSTEPLKAALNDAFDGSSIDYRIVNKNAKRRKVEQYRLSIFGALATGFLRAEGRRSDWETGFWPRWLWMISRRERFYPIECPVLDTIVDGWYQWLTSYLQQRATEPIGRCIGYDTLALTRYEEWARSIDAEEQKAPNGWTRALLSRVPVQVRKVALLLAFDQGYASSSSLWTIPLSCLEAAIVIGEMHRKSAEIASEMICGSEYARDRQLVLDAFARAPQSGVLSDGEIHQHTGFLYTKQRMDRIIETMLVESTLYRLATSDRLYSTSPPAQVSYGNVLLVPFGPRC